MPQDLSILDLGKLKQSICSPELKAAASCAHAAGCGLAKLTSAEGGVIYIDAQAASDDAPVRVYLSGPITIVGSDHYPVTVAAAPLLPVAAGCRAPLPHTRLVSAPMHFADTSKRP